MKRHLSSLVLRTKHGVFVYLAITSALFCVVLPVRTSRTSRTARNQQESLDYIKNNNLQELMSKPIINHHEFQYIHNPAYRCSERPVDVLFAVPSAPGNSWKRQKFRSIVFLDHLRTTGLNVSLLFFIGVSTNGAKNKTFQSTIDNESRHYNDIVQETYTDSFKTIRLKAVAILKWIQTFCSNVKYVIRVDDDTKFVINDLIEVVYEKGGNYSNFILGKPRAHSPVVRERHSMYYVSHREYPTPEEWPTFCPGGLLGYSWLTASFLYQAALRLSPVWLEDVFITGICGKALNVTHVSDERFTSIHCNCHCN